MLTKRRILVLVPLIIAVVVLAWPLSFLQITERKTGKPIFLEPVEAGDQFVLSYIHSVENIPVFGKFGITKGGKIEAVETAFSSYGTGLPLFVPQKQVSHREGLMVVKHKDFFLNKVPIVVIKMTKQTVKLKDSRILLSDHVRDGKIVDIKIIRKPRLYRILGHLISSLEGIAVR
ncbi:MAG: DUF1850 domain-containing protein [Deltaproteobacteria bacterium]|nr:DUF1850 domain-containing protein [Deltaproteobacteria bacterium]MBW1961508.1 DUF1850 domain-containing protein [Deltaproteobacteria bacterium]MBW2152673.1 DUF1850 domain-containing protein [Deltaproteobacteria bacterium]